MISVVRIQGMKSVNRWILWVQQRTAALSTNPGAYQMEFGYLKEKEGREGRR